MWPDHWPLLGGPRCGGVPQGPEVLVSAWSSGRSPGPLAGLASGGDAPPPNSFPCLAQEEELIQSENSASIFNTLSDIPSQIEDAELLLGEAMRLAGSLTDVAVETQRRKHLAYLIADQGQLLGTSAATNLSQVGP